MPDNFCISIASDKAMWLLSKLNHFGINFNPNTFGIPGKALWWVIRLHPIDRTMPLNIPKTKPWALIRFADHLLIGHGHKSTWGRRIFRAGLTRCPVGRQASVAVAIASDAYGAESQAKRYSWLRVILRSRLFLQGCAESVEGSLAPFVFDLRGNIDPRP